MTGHRPYDPTIYGGSAPFYARGRPPYSAALGSTLAAEAGLDGTGRLLDVGCGPGVPTVELAPLAAEAVGLDPDPDMLAEGARRAAEAGVAAAIGWVRARAEDIPDLDLGTFRLVTFGQSFHWTDRERVAEIVYDHLEPGGTIALLAHTVAGRPRPPGPGPPPIPHDAIRDLVARYLGPRRRSGQGYSSTPPDRYEDALARTRFGRPRIVFAPGRPDVVRDVDGVVAGTFSLTTAAPHLFAARRAAFEADLRDLLWSRSPTGEFWDWPGDTEIVLAHRPR